MALDSIVTSCVQPSVSGTQVVDGWGFTPKLVLCWSVSLTADGGGAGQAYSFGAATATAQRGFGVSASDNAEVFAASVGGSDTAAIVLRSTGGGYGAEGYVTLTATGISIDWAVAESPPQRVVLIVGLGGSDLLNAEVGTLAVPSAPGPQTLVHGGFTPNAILVAGPTVAHALTAQGAFSQYVTHGWATAASSYTTGWILRHADLAAIRWQSNDRVAVQLELNSILTEAAVTGFAADQTTLTWQHVTAGTELLYVALEATQAAIATVTQPATATTLAVPGLGFQPSVVLSLCGWSETGWWDHRDVIWAAPGISGNSYMSLGADNGTTQVVAGQSAVYSAAPTNASSFMDRTKLQTVALPNHGTPTLAYIDSHVSDLSTPTGGFTVTYDHMGDANGRAESFLALGTGAGAPTGLPPAVAMHHAALQRS